MDMSSMHPNLAVVGADAAIDFYVRAFGAERVDTVTAGDAIIHSDLRIGGSTFTVAEQFPGSGSVAPEPGTPTPVSFTLPVDDVDAVHARAVEAGATSDAEPGDWFEGFRQASVRCPFGHRWFLVKVDPSITVADVQRASDAWMTTQTD